MELWTGNKTLAGSSLIWSQDNVQGAGDSGFILINANGADQTVTIPAGGNYTYIKTDNSLHTVELVPSTGYSFADGQQYFLYNQYESVALEEDSFKIYEINNGVVVPFFSTIVMPVSATSAVLIEMNALSTNVAVTLDVDNTEYIVLRIDAGSSFIATINAPVGCTIAGSATYTLTVGGETVHLLLVGTNYYPV
jgi:hypothetical protein